MTKIPSRTVGRAALASALFIAGATVVQAQPQQLRPLVIPAPVAPSPLVAVPQIGAASVGVTAPNVAGVSVGVVAPKAAKVSAAVVLAQMEMGQIASEQAWATGSLSLEEVVHAANAFPIRDLNTDRIESPLFKGLLELLVQHGQERWMPVKEEAKIVGEPLSHNVRLGVADTLSQVRDERAVAVYEDMLKEIECTKDKRSAPRTVGALNHLALFYWGQGQLQKAADIFLTGDRYSSSPAWAAATRFDAARVYQEMGESSKAQELYAEVKQGKDSFFRGMATYDQGLLLVDSNPIQARDLVLSDLQHLPNREDQVGPLWILAQAQWNLENWPQAEVTLRELLQVCAEHPSSREGFDTIQLGAQSLLEALLKWKTKTFVLPVQKLLAHPGENGVYHATLYVHSLKPQPLNVRFADGKVRLNALTLQRQKRTDLGVLVTIYDVSYSTSLPTTSVVAFVESKNSPTATQQIELRESP